MIEVNTKGTIVRSPSLDEWFLIYQLKKVNLKLHLPFYFDADISLWADHYKAQGHRIPFTEVLIKAIAFLGLEIPQINRAVFHTILGERFIDFSYAAVNLPVSLIVDGQYVLSALTIRDPHQKTNREIREEIKACKQKNWDQLPINRIIHKSKNKFIAKLKLRFMHFIFNNFPSLYIKRGGGGLTVSSLMNLAQENSKIFMMAYSQSAFTVSSCASYELNGKTYLKVGLAFDHFACHGEIGTKAALRLCEILQGKEDNFFKSFIRESDLC
jgi:hypothetical protein